MKFQGEILLLAGWFWQQFLMDGSCLLQFSVFPFEKPAAMTRITQESIKPKNMGISFFVCIAVV